MLGEAVPTTLQVVPDADRIGANDAVRVMVRMLDQAGHKLPFYPEPVTITVSGNARLLGPSLVPLRAGSTGLWVQATGAGPIELRVHCDRLDATTIHLTAE